MLRQMKEGGFTRTLSKEELLYTPKFTKGDWVHHKKAEWTGGGYENGSIIECWATKMVDGKPAGEKCSFYICKQDEKTGRMEATKDKRKKPANKLHAGWV